MRFAGFRRAFCAPISLWLVLAACAAPAHAQETSSPGIFLPNQWTLRPTGTSIPLGDFPINMTLSPDGRLAAIVHCGFGQHEVRVVDLAKRQELCKAPLDRAWYGAAFSADGKKLFVSAGSHDTLRCYDFTGKALKNPTSIALTPKPATPDARELFYPSGIAITPDGKTAYVAAQYANRLLRADLTRPQATATTVTLFTPPHAYPYKVLLHPDQKRAYVSLWGAKAVAEVELASGKCRLLSTDSHPNEMVLSRDGLRLFVACANTNLVDVIDTKAARVCERLDTALFPSMPAGSTPDALALSPDQQTLLAANADNNMLAVFDVSRPGATRPKGFIPTGWYPSALGFSPKGEIVVVNAKGNASMANPKGPSPYTDVRTTQYIGGLLLGTLAFIDFPDAKALEAHTKRAYACSPLRPDLLPPASPEPGNPVPARVGQPSPIKYCVYIIKENRTYDQVLGDMKQGNGDSSLCLFGEEITPNHHALASEFVLLDNFYTEAEVSADGHEWTTGAYATDFVEKSWPPNYGGHGNLPYKSEGTDPVNDPEAGHLWDRAKKAGVSYRSWGEFVFKNPRTGNYETSVESLIGHVDPKYPDFNMEISDLVRTKEFLRELAEYEKTGELPRLCIIRLPNDHTAGTRKGMRTPRSYLAQNDLSLGIIMEALSKSRFWKEMAVFVVEDDAQNGADHVDAHRTVALLAGPYVKRNHVDSHLYSTASMLRTIELILGLEPMSQFDAAALPMYACFTSTPDAHPYRAKPARAPLDEITSDGAPMQRQSAALDLSREDACPDVLFNEIIWKAMRGDKSTMPPPVRAAFVRPVEEREDEDD